MLGFWFLDCDHAPEARLMQSKNKPAMTAAERAHVDRIRQMECAVCAASGPSEAHEPKQGSWFLSIPLCASCHRDGFNGLHGQRRAWAVRKLDELDALNITIKRLML